MKGKKKNEEKKEETKENKINDQVADEKLNGHQDKSDDGKENDT